MYQFLLFNINFGFSSFFNKYELMIFDNNLEIIKLKFSIKTFTESKHFPMMKSKNHKPYNQTKLYLSNRQKNNK